MKFSEEEIYFGKEPKKISRRWTKAKGSHSSACPFRQFRLVQNIMGTNKDIFGGESGPDGSSDVSGPIENAFWSICGLAICGLAIVTTKCQLQKNQGQYITGKETK